MDFAQLFQLAQDNVFIVSLIGAGLFGPALAGVVVAILNLPYIRDFIGGFCFMAGKWFSAFLTGRLGAEWGPKLENTFQSFLTDVIVGKFFAGLDVDDEFVRVKP